MDPRRSRAGQSGPFGGTIAHGYWTLSAAPFIMRGGEGVQVRLPSRMGINYGLNRVRFINPVHVGKRIRGRTKLVSVDEVQPERHPAGLGDHDRDRRRDQAGHGGRVGHTRLPAKRSGRLTHGTTCLTHAAVRAARHRVSDHSGGHGRRQRGRRGRAGAGRGGFGSRWSGRPRAARVTTSTSSMRRAPRSVD